METKQFFNYDEAEAYSAQAQEAGFAAEIEGISGGYEVKISELKETGITVADGNKTDPQAPVEPTPSETGNQNTKSEGNQNQDTGKTETDSKKGSKK